MKPVMKEIYRTIPGETTKRLYVLLEIKTMFKLTLKPEQPQNDK
jgi:hypothetical protein